MRTILYILLKLILTTLFVYSKDNDMIYVHMIPHSHDDYGWLFTIDQYYNNPSPFAAQGSVKDIINSVYQEVQKNSTRKFIQVEIGFLNMWWQQQGQKEKIIYKNLIESGQIEIINGGWTMHDEATPYFEDIIDQMTVGHLWVKDNLGVIPTIGWQLDPFGHQSSNAALYSQMGFNAQWFARIDYQDFAMRKINKEVEMIWSPQQQSGEENYIFSAVNINHYSPPKDFYFEKGEIVSSYNIKVKSDQFVNYFKNMATQFRSNNLLHTMGEDFAYSRANVWYDSMDQLITYINERSSQYNMKILYSTPSQYLAEVNKQNIKFPLNSHDFFPYADQVNAYWTGYFTSRPAVKGFTKDSGRYLQAIRNIFAVENMNKRTAKFQQNFQNYLKNLEFFEQQVAAMSHHDAVTGTQRQAVVTDYVKRLNEGYSQIRSHLHPLLQQYAEQDIQEQEISYTQCNWNATISQCSITNDQLTQQKSVLIMVHNPSATRNMNIRIKVPQIALTVINQLNLQVPSDVICSNPNNQQDCDLYFSDKVEGYSQKYYKITTQILKNSKPIQPKKQNPGQNIINLEISASTTLIIDIKQSKFSYEMWVQQEDKDIRVYKAKRYNFALQYNYYTSKVNSGQISGAYIFRPVEDQSQLYSQIKNITIFQGKTVTVLVLAGNKTTTQMRVFSDSSMERVFELETFVHSIDITDSKGKEVVMLVSTDLKNNQTFYTDSNGLEMQERKINYRPTWKYLVNEPVSGNYYPIGAMISLQDQTTKQKLIIVNDRSQGGTSLQEGQLEIMLHRRMLKDDGRGVAEALNEPDDIDPKKGLEQKLRHYIIFEDENEELGRRIQNELDSAPLIFLSKSKISYFNIQKADIQDSPLSSNKNPNLRVYFRTFNNYYTMRLYNISDKQNAEFQLPNNFKIEDELTLTANQSRAEWKNKQMKWTTDNGKVFENKYNPADAKKEMESKIIKLKPLQLRVFKVVKLN